jgi:hypothetical protein
MWCPIPYASRLWLHEMLGWSASGEARLALGNPTHIEAAVAVVHCWGRLAGSLPMEHLCISGCEEEKSRDASFEEGLAYTDLFYGRRVRPFTKEHVRVQQLSLTRKSGHCRPPIEGCLDPSAYLVKDAESLLLENDEAFVFD